jgi:hypothetical protein
VTRRSHLTASFLEVDDDRSGSKSIMHPGRAASEGSGTSGANAVSVRDPRYPSAPEEGTGLSLPVVGADLAHPPALRHAVSHAVSAKSSPYPQSFHSDERATHGSGRQRRG